MTLKDNPDNNLNIMDNMESMDNEALNRLPGLTLAYLGDGVYELGVRRYLLSKGILKADELHKATVEYVNASFQSKFYYHIESLLNEEEQAVLKRGRNAKSPTRSKSCSVGQYRNATGVEALFGHVYLSGDEARLKQLFGLLYDFINNKDNCNKE